MSSFTETPKGTLRQRKVGDSHYANETFRVIPSMSLHDFNNVRQGTLMRLRRRYFVHDGIFNSDPDVGRTQRFAREARESWGFVVPLMSQLLFANTSQGIRKGHASAIAVTTTTQDAHLTPMARGNTVSADVLRRQLQLELEKYVDHLTRSLTTTATASLMVRFLSIHTQLDYRVPTKADADKALAEGKQLPGKHRELIALVLQRLPGEFAARMTELEQVSAEHDGATARRVERLAGESSWWAEETTAFVAAIESCETDEAMFEPVLVGKLKQCSSQLSAAAAASKPPAGVMSNEVRTPQIG
jgi:hypothetical protein